MEEWKIRPRARQCSHCGRSFELGDKVYSLLLPNAEARERSDYCEESWKALGSSLPKGACRWASRVRRHPTTTPRGPTTDWAEERLRELLQKKDPAEEEKLLAFLLAGWLQRKRLLRQLGQKSQASTKGILLFEHLSTGELWEIPLPEEMGWQNLEQAERRLQLLWKEKREIDQRNR
jgi:hypothetical protein